MQEEANIQVEQQISNSFRSKSSFGKRMEHWVISKMLKEGLDVYIPVVDDNAIDAVVKRPDGRYVEIQIKARSCDVEHGASALFAAIPHNYRPYYWFVFYSERLNTMWILSSKEFLEESYKNKSGKNAGKHSLKFNNSKDEINPKYDKYRAYSFDRIKNENPK